MTPGPEHYYLNNPNIKRAGVQWSYTDEETQEYLRCMTSPQYFIKKYCKIISIDRGLVDFDLYSYQDKLVDHFEANRFSVVMAPRQSGKSQICVGYLTWYACFHQDKKIAILANKAATAREILSRVTLMLENLPFFLQPGCKALNKGSIEFDGNTTIFSSATSSSSIRGQSCVTGDTHITIIQNDDDVYYTEISNLINNSEFIESKTLQTPIHYIVYQTTNLINGKIYVGYHATKNLDDGYIGSGKLLKRAVEKYGPENFYREIIADFETSEEAEILEALIVDEKFVDDDSNYNLSLGSNVCALPGESNPFYGKRHSDEILTRISEKSRGSRRDYDFNGYGGVHLQTGVAFASLAEAKDMFGYSTTLRIILAAGKTDPEIKFFDERQNELARKTFERHEEAKDSKRRLLARLASERFSGVKLSDERRKEISMRMLETVKTEEFKSRILAINKDPDKIRKTAEKHRGMKRSIEARMKMSAAHKGRTAFNKGLKRYHNPLNIEEAGYYQVDQQPADWLPGSGRSSARRGKKYYHDPIDPSRRCFCTPSEAPVDWVPGMGSNYASTDA